MIKQLYEVIAYDVYCDNRKFPTFWTIIGLVKLLYRIISCKIFGHKLVDYGCAGPDHGYIDVCCERCGYSHGIEHLY